MALTSPHKHIKNTSTYGTIITECQPKPGTTYTTKAARKIPTGWREKNKKEKEMRMYKCPGRELYQRKDSFTLTTTFSGRRSSGINRELEWPGLCLRGVCGCWLARRQGRERPALIAVTLSHFPAWNAYLLVHAVDGCWTSGFSKGTWGEDTV